MYRVIALSILTLGMSAMAVDVLPNTKPLVEQADWSAKMVAQVDAWLIRQIEASISKRDSDPTKITEKRAWLSRQLGVVDKRLPPELEITGSLEDRGILFESDAVQVMRIRWAVLEGMDAEGLAILPAGKPRGWLVLVPDADTTPEALVGLQIGSAATGLLDSGYGVLIPALVDRDNTYSINKQTGTLMNVTHREWIYRRSFVQGRHVIGLEVQKLLAAVDWMKARHAELPVTVAGIGEGGMLALYVAALDERIGAVHVAGYFGPRERVWEEPIYRNVQDLLRGAGDAEVAAMIAPRALHVHLWGWPLVAGPPAPKEGQRNIAAPGKLEAHTKEAVMAEAERARALVGKSDWLTMHDDSGNVAKLIAALPGVSAGSTAPVQADHALQSERRQERMVNAMSEWCQRRLEAGERERDAAFWQKRPPALEEYVKWTEPKRDEFWKNVIGDLPWADVPMNPRSKLVRETDKVLVYEVVLDVWQDVIAWGWLALPKDMPAGKKLPVVVCQHGLEGVPEDCLNDDPASKAWNPYKAFALKLAEQGYVTFSPHNLYRGGDAFRGLQRKLNVLGKSLFSVIIPQHARILEWLKTQPWTDEKRIAFYGLSYGGKSAMRIPAVLTDYCLSICSGDFNEWVRKCASNSMRMSYIFTHEYEIWEWNLGGSYNYAEMAALIAPRPFMVERGHDDGVGTDEWVNYEYAKVRRLYEKLGIGDRTTIEHFNAGHTINGVVTFEFLKRHLVR